MQSGKTCHAKSHKPVLLGSKTYIVVRHEKEKEMFLDMQYNVNETAVRCHATSQA